MKPIPPNRRWEAYRAQQQEVTSPAPSPAINVTVVVVEPPVIRARYAGTCPVCRRAIQPGMDITRHASTHRWVHRECRNTPISNSFPARYAGFCRACRQSIQVGEMIARDATHGWVHQHCQRNHEVHIDGETTMAEIDALICELIDEELDEWGELVVG